MFFSGWLSFYGLRCSRGVEPRKSSLVMATRQTHVASVRRHRVLLWCGRDSRRRVFFSLFRVSMRWRAPVDGQRRRTLRASFRVFRVLKTLRFNYRKRCTPEISSHYSREHLLWSSFIRIFISCRFYQGFQCSTTPEWLASASFQESMPFLNRSRWTREIYTRYINQQMKWSSFFRMRFLLRNDRCSHR